MRRLRLKADGRIVELHDGAEMPLVPELPPGADVSVPSLDVRALRSRSQLTQVEFAERGGWVAGQSGEGCYDPEAASQLAVAGHPAGTPEYLAGELAQRSVG